MIESLSYEDYGPDGAYLRIQGDLAEAAETYLDGIDNGEHGPMQIKVTDEALLELHDSLKAWHERFDLREEVRREHQHEGAIDLALTRVGISDSDRSFEQILADVEEHGLSDEELLREAGDLARKRDKEN